jgi:hypothetical protein
MIKRLWCWLFHRSSWRTRHGIFRECIKCDTLTIVETPRVETSRQRLIKLVGATVIVTVPGAIYVLHKFFPNVIDFILAVWLGIGALFALHAFVVNAFITGWPEDWALYERSVQIVAMWIGWPLIFLRPWRTSSAVEPEQAEAVATQAVAGAAGREREGLA